MDKFELDYIAVFGRFIHESVDATNALVFINKISAMLNRHNHKQLMKSIRDNPSWMHDDDAFETLFKNKEQLLLKYTCLLQDLVICIQSIPTSVTLYRQRIPGVPSMWFRVGSWETNSIQVYLIHTIRRMCELSISTLFGKWKLHYSSNSTWLSRVVRYLRFALQLPHSMAASKSSSSSSLKKIDVSAFKWADREESRLQDMERMRMIRCLRLSAMKKHCVAIAARAASILRNDIDHLITMDSTLEFITRRQMVEERLDALCEQLHGTRSESVIYPVGFLCTLWDEIGLLLERMGYHLLSKLCYVKRKWESDSVSQRMRLIWMMRKERPYLPVKAVTFDENVLVDNAIECWEISNTARYSSNTVNMNNNTYTNTATSNTNNTSSSSSTTTLPVATSPTNILRNSEIIAETIDPYNRIQAEDESYCIERGWIDIDDDIRRKMSRRCSLAQRRLSCSTIIPPTIGTTRGASGGGVWGPASTTSTPTPVGYLSVFQPRSTSAIQESFLHAEPSRSSSSSESNGSLVQDDDDIYDDDEFKQEQREDSESEFEEEKDSLP